MIKYTDISKYYMPVTHIVKGCGLAYYREKVWSHLLSNIGEPSPTIIFAIDFFLVASWVFTSLLFFVLSSEKKVSNLRNRIIYISKAIYWASLVYLYYSLRDDVTSSEYMYAGVSSSGFGLLLTIYDFIMDTIVNSPDKVKEEPQRRVVSFV
jgi:hypothetical protein